MGTLIRRAQVVGLFLVLLGGLACRRVAPEEAALGSAPEPSSPREAATGATSALWVWADAPTGGDGSRERPYATLAEAFEAAEQLDRARIRLRPGRYVGPFVLADGTELIGAPGVVLASGPAVQGPRQRAAEAGGADAPEDERGARSDSDSDASVPLLRAEGRVVLEALTLEVGDVPLTGPGPWTLDGVTLRGTACLSLSGDAQLAVRASRFVATRPGGRCLAFSETAQGRLEEVAFEGGWREGLSLGQEAVVTAEGLTSRGAHWAIRQRGGTLRLSHASLMEGIEAGVYVARGRLELRSVSVKGHAYGFMLGQAATVRGQGLLSTGAERAGLALVAANVSLSDLEVRDLVGSGAFAGVQVLGGDALLRDLRIHRVRAGGLSQRDGRLTLENVEIADVEAGEDGSEGAGLSVRKGTATLRGSVSLRGLGGPGVLVAEGGTLRAEQLPIRGAGWAGAVVETLGALEVGALDVRDTAGPALWVTERSRATVEHLTVRGSERTVSETPPVVVARCEEGAQVALGALEGATWPELACLRRLKGRITPKTTAGP